MSVSEAEENMVGCQSYTKGNTKDEQPVDDLLDDQVQPGEQLLVVHRDKDGTRDRFAHGVLDVSNHSFNCTNPFMMFR